MLTKQKFISGHNRPGKRINVKGVVVHWTANEGKGANAMANRNYFQSTDRSASAHLLLDDTTLVEALPWRKGVAEMAYHVGATKYNQTTVKQLGSTYPNNATIGLEVCVNADGDFKKAYANSIQVTAMMLKEHGLGIDRLYRHYDVTGKNCPAYFVDNGYAKKYLNTTPATAWANFRAAVAKALGQNIKVDTGIRVLGKGDSGSDVKELQEKLVKLGYKIAVDSVFGAGTDTAVKDFQAKHGLKADGLAGDDTFAKIADDLKPLTIVKPAPNPEVALPSVTIDRTIGVATIKADTLNMRKGPGTKYATIKSLPKGSTWKVYDKQDGWYSLGVGWISGASESYCTYEQRIIEVTADVLNLRKEPNTSASVVRQLKKGEHYRVYSTKGDWVCLGPGWVHGAYIETV